MSWKKSWKIRRRDVLIGGAAVLGGCGPVENIEWPLAQWPEEEDVPSAIPQNAQLAKPWKSSLYDPLVLFAETTLATGAAVSPNTAALANPHALPMELLAVKFRIHTLNDAANTDPQSVSGLGVGVKMDMGDIPLVDAGVPVSLLSTARDDSEDSELGYTVFSTSTLATATGALARVYDHFWRLQYPLFIPPKAVVVPLFSHLTQTPWDVKVGVTYYCRVHRESKREPTEVQVPWVTKYLSKSFDVFINANVADSDQSSELDIRNPFPDSRVEIQRLTGRANFYRIGTGSELNTNYERGYADQTNRYLRVAMRSSRGDEIIQRPTLFSSVFPQCFKSWEIGNSWYMQPNEFYDIRLTRDAFNTFNATTSTARMQVAIGCVGYRKINTSTLRGAA